MKKIKIKNKISKKDRFSLYVFLIVMSSTAFSMLSMNILNSIFKTENYRTLNYIIFICVAFLISSSIASKIISNSLRKTKQREKLVKTLLEKVANNQFDYRFDEKSMPELKYDIENFNKILTELNSVAILKEDFISSFSHQFKTPITSIKGFAEIIKSKPDLDLKRKNEYLDIIIDESSNLSNLSKNILLMSKLTAQTTQEHKTIYSLDEQLSEVIFLLDNQFSEKNIETNISIDKIKINACKEIMQNVWLNLLTNAIKFTKDTISISAKIEQDNIVVKITDNGIGISQENFNKIFDRYYQCSTNKIAGNGLGLPIVKRIVELANGKIDVESEINKGSTFIVYLPNKLN